MTALSFPPWLPIRSHSFYFYFPSLSYIPSPLPHFPNSRISPAYSLSIAKGDSNYEHTPHKAPNPSSFRCLNGLGIASRWNVRHSLDLRGMGTYKVCVFDLLFYTRILYLVTNPSEPAPGTRHRRTVVDGLPSRVLHPHFKTRGSHPVPKVRIVTLQFLFKYLPGRLIGTLQYD